MHEKKVIYKPWYNYEKEEKWLNDLASEGWSMVDMWLFRYVFEKTEPGTYAYKIILLENLVGHPKSKATIDFIEETGIEHISHWLRWVYFRRKTKDGPLDIYTDRASQLKHFQTISVFWLTMAIIEFMAGGLNLFLGLMILLDEGVFTSNLFLGGLLILLGFFLLRLGKPINRKINLLKAEMIIHE